MDSLIPLAIYINGLGMGAQKIIFQGSNKKAFQLECFQ
jgi:hypothetical protein